jgi:hypothetical protein
MGSARIRFLAHDTVRDPWLVDLFVENVFTRQSFTIPVDTRTLAYLRIATFLALASAWPAPAIRRGLQALGLGLAMLLILICGSLLLAITQVLGMVKVLALGVFAQSVLSVGILTLVTYPSMAFALPGLIWWMTLQLASSAENTFTGPGRSARPSMPVVAAKRESQR